jgi:hypothetical protein
MSDTEEDVGKAAGGRKDEAAAGGSALERKEDGKEEGKEGDVIGKRVRVKRWNAVAFWSYGQQQPTAHPYPQRNANAASAAGSNCLFPCLWLTCRSRALLSLSFFLCRHRERHVRHVRCTFI